MSYLDLIFLSWYIWFHSIVLALVNRAALKTGVHVSSQIHIFSGSKPRSGRVGLANHMVPLCLVFFCLFVCFFKETHASTHTSYTHLHPNKERRRIPFSLSPLQDFLLIDLFDAGHSESCEVISHGGFDWHCFRSSWCGVSFRCFTTDLLKLASWN